MMALGLGFLLPLLLCGVLYLYLKRKTNYWKNKGVPCEDDLPLFGNFLEITLRNDNVGKYIQRLYNKFDAPYFGFTTFGRPYLVVKDPEILKRILIKDFHVFPNRFFVSDPNIDPIMSYSLLGIKNPQWRLLRTKLSPIFSSGKIKMMTYLMTKCAENLSKHINTIVGSKAELRELAAKYTTDVISTCAFGIEANSFVNDHSPIRVAGRKLTKSSLYRTIQALSYSFAPLLVRIFKFKFFEGEAVKFLSSVFVETIKQREATHHTRNDLIDILINLRKNETQDDTFKFEGDKLIAQALMFFLAGHDATSTTINFALHQLCVHPQIQERVRQEIFDVIEKHGGITYEAIQDAKYLQQVIDETLRLYVVTPFVQRECIANYIVPETGLLIESGTNIIIPQHGLHYDPKYFNNPEEFDPDRFSEENKHNIPSCAYVPFGEGPRNCLGERFGLVSVKLGIMHILKEFTVEKNADTSEALVFKRSDLLRTATEIYVTFARIDKKNKIA